MPPIYSLDHVTKRYADRQVLEVPDLIIQHGDILALVGPSGAGKSTLLRMLALLEAPTGGSLNLSINGQTVDYNSASIHDRRRVGMVFQRPVLLSRSVWENVAYGLRLRGEKDIDAQVEQALERVSLSHLRTARPDTLSGGELQRVVVARTMVTRPDILLLDEPTANLDPANIHIIEDLIREQHEQHQITIVIITHNIFQAKRLATRVGLIWQGALIEVAATAAFFENPQDERVRAFVSGDLIY